ncbi:MAG: MBL fold metallo-hydrolase [Planctomycetota bacterium]|nr:MAG: MBL fold metallo-hydrolase [Planctomycetota bacterium]
MKVTVWGARGSVPVSGAQVREVGGNTSCVEVVCGGERLILDGGTGLRALGERLGGAPLRATILFSHLHWDHIQGVPFFAPAYHPGSELTLAGVRRRLSLREVLARQMAPPTFPVGIEALAGAKRFLEVVPGRPFEVGPFRITPFEQEHPNGVACFRIEAEGRALVYATDVEHGGEVDELLVERSAGADLLVHDAQYHWGEYAGVDGPSRRGWGHSSWLEAVAAAQRAEVRRLLLFHHDPGRDDEAVRDIEALAQERFAGAFAAREGMVLGL